MNLLNKETSLNYIHFPKNEDSIKEALRTLKFEECLEYCLKNKIAREESKAKSKTNIKDIDTNADNIFLIIDVSSSLIYN